MPGSKTVDTFTNPSNTAVAFPFSPLTLAHIRCFVKPPSCHNGTYVSNFTRNFYDGCALAGKTKFWAGGLAAAQPNGDASVCEGGEGADQAEDEPH